MTERKRDGKKEKDSKIHRQKETKTASQRGLIVYTSVLIDSGVGAVNI